MKSLLRSSLFYGDVIGINGVQDKVSATITGSMMMMMSGYYKSSICMTRWQYFTFLFSLSVFRRRRRKEHCSTFSSVKMNTSIILTSSYNFYSYDHHIDDYRLRSRRLSSRQMLPCPYQMLLYNYYFYVYVHTTDPILHKLTDDRQLSVIRNDFMTSSAFRREVVRRGGRTDEQRRHHLYHYFLYGRFIG